MMIEMFLNKKVGKKNVPKTVCCMTLLGQVSQVYSDFVNTYLSSSTINFA